MIQKKRWIIGLALVVIVIALGSRCERGGPPPRRPSRAHRLAERVEAEVVVPELRNNTVDAARLIAAENDLLFAVAGEEKSREFSKDCICRQNPMRGSKVKRGSVVKVWVSKGK